VMSNMKKLTKALGLTAILAAAIPLTAYAATTNPADAAQKNTDTPAYSKSVKPFKHVAYMAYKGGEWISQNVLDLLKLDAKSLKEKLAAGKTLAQIAEEQGVTRDQLKQALTDAFNRKMEERKQQFAAHLDNLVDRQLPHKKPDAGKPEGKGPFLFNKIDLQAMISKLGVTNAELKQALAAGKSIADLAKEKGVDVQTLIDAEKAAITDAVNQAVKNGKLTQEQANKQIERAQTIAEKIVNHTPHRVNKGAASGESKAESAS